MPNFLFPPSFIHRVISISILFTLFVGFLIFQVPVASAYVYRRPLNTILSPMVSYYYDDNPGPGVSRYTCATDRVYNNHQGVDFRAYMGTPIYNGAYGALDVRIDGCPDYGYWGSTCGSGFGNHIRLLHMGLATNARSIYAHMKRGTPAVFYTRFCGGYLGQTGSSGNSTGPHLHFEHQQYAYPYNDLFAGACSGWVGYWTSTQDGVPSTRCSW